MLLVGGYSRVSDVDPEAECDPEFIKVFDLNTVSVSYSHQSSNLRSDWSIWFT
jgi:hypothetical protein